jgi:hypothetical protein
MATKREIVYNILNLLEGGRVSDDTIPSYRQISFIVDYKRAQYLRQDQTKNWFDMDTIYQDLGILKMVEVDSSECCAFESGCKIFRTEKKIPQLLRFSLRHAIKINAINKRTRFELILPERFDFISYVKFSRLNQPVYFLNGYLYTSEIYALNVRAALAKPDDAKGFICADGKQCFTDDMEYPLPQDIIDLITKDILSTESKLLLAITQDLENDTKDNNVPTS